MRLPNWGSAICREKKRLMGVMKNHAFSMKNGRFSGKKTVKRWLMVTCGSSDSTWLKSGFSVTSNVRESLATNLASSPARCSNLSIKLGGGVTPEELTGAG